MQYQIILGSAAALLAIYAHIPYLLDTIRGKTKPHLYSWGVWSLLMIVGMAAQIIKGAGFGSWATIGDFLPTFLVFLFALKFGEKNITTSDTIALIGGIISIAVWVTTNDPLWAVIFVTLADAFGFFPTFRKSYMKPHEETLSTHVIVAFAYSLGILAIGSYSITTVLYPAYLLIGNGALAIFLFIRRTQLKHA